MQNENSSVNAQYQTIVIVWAALLVSQLLFLVLIFFTKPEVFKFDFSKSSLGENTILIAVLALAAVSNFVISFILKKKYLDQAVAEQKPALVQTAVVIACALCESISLFGFVLVFVESYQYFFLWFALTFVGFILHFPRRESLIAASYKR